MPCLCQGQSACLCQGHWGLQPPSLLAAPPHPLRVTPQEGMTCTALLLGTRPPMAESCTRSLPSEGESISRRCLSLGPWPRGVVRSNFLLGPRDRLSEPLHLIITTTEAIASGSQDLSAQSRAVTALRLSLHASPQGSRSSSPVLPALASYLPWHRSRARGLQKQDKEQGPRNQHDSQGSRTLTRDLHSRPCQPQNSRRPWGRHWATRQFLQLLCKYT